MESGIGGGGERARKEGEGGAALFCLCTRETVALTDCGGLISSSREDTLKTVYEVPISFVPEENLLYKQIYLIPNQKFLYKGILGL